jgi:hypothetical protein
MTFFFLRGYRVAGMTSVALGSKQYHLLLLMNFQIWIFVMQSYHGYFFHCLSSLQVIDAIVSNDLP